MKHFQIIINSFFKSLPIILVLLFSCSESKFDFSKINDASSHIDSLNNIIAEKSNADSIIIEEANNLFKLSLAMGYEKGLAESASQKMRLLRIDFQYDNALQFISENLELFNEFKDISNQVLIYEEIGLLYLAFDDFDQAFFYLTKALSYYENSKDQKKEAFILSRIGIIFRNNDLEKAKEYLEKSLEISIKINDSIGISRDLNNIAYYYNKLKVYDTAKVYYQQAMLINENIGNWDYYATNLLNLANIEKKTNNNEGSIKLYTQLTYAFDSLNKKNKYALVFLHLGEAYLNLKDYKKAIGYFAYADSLGQKFSLTSVKRNSKWGLYHCYNEQGKYELAIKYLEEQHELDNNLRSKRNFQELTRLELQFKNDQLVRKKMWEQQRLKFILYFTLVVLLFFIAFLFQLFRKQKFKMAKQKLEQKVLQNELEGKERELTSLVLNMIRLNEKKLSIIAYLRKQKHRLKKENQNVIDTTIQDLEYDQDAKVWEEFEMRFNNVNGEFYKKLASRFPDLTINEKRLCAFLLMNMTTKEISSITGQSTEAIGKGRTRLRKKLNLTNKDDSITSVLSTL